MHRSGEGRGGEGRGGEGRGGEGRGGEGRGGEGRGGEGRGGEGRGGEGRGGEGRGGEGRGGEGRGGEGGGGGLRYQELPATVLVASSSPASAVQTNSWVALYSSTSNTSLLPTKKTVFQTLFQTSSFGPLLLVGRKMTPSGPGYVKAEHSTLRTPLSKCMKIGPSISRTAEKLILVIITAQVLITHKLMWRTF